MPRIFLAIALLAFFYPYLPLPWVVAYPLDVVLYVASRVSLLLALAALVSAEYRSRPGALR
ncbi:MAG: hypothetical protein EOP82_32230 [Variovorax sp.]|nr:MAG: hypothetical protein EOP82_32230 [Variovorax sp.]